MRTRDGKSLNCRRDRGASSASFGVRQRPREGKRGRRATSRFPAISRADADGIVWVALASEPNPALDSLHKAPLFLRRLAARPPESVLPKPWRVAWISAYDDRRASVRDVKWADGGFAMATGVCCVGRRIWCAGLQGAR